MKIHSINIFTHKSECGKEGEVSGSVNKITCLKCLESDRREWKKQVDTFRNQPLTNAQKGLKDIEKRIRELKKNVKAKKGEQK